MRRRGNRIRVNGKLYEAVGNADLERISDEIWDISNRYIKGSYRYTVEDYVGRRTQEAIQFAKALMKNKPLFNEIAANYKEVYDYLEDMNYHTENLGLEYLFDTKAFEKDVLLSLRSCAKYV